MAYNSNTDTGNTSLQRWQEKYQYHAFGKITSISPTRSFLGGNFLIIDPLLSAFFFLSFFSLSCLFFFSFLLHVFSSSWNSPSPPFSDIKAVVPLIISRFCVFSPSPSPYSLLPPFSLSFPSLRLFRHHHPVGPPRSVWVGFNITAISVRIIFIIRCVSLFYLFYYFLILCLVSVVCYCCTYPKASLTIHCQVTSTRRRLSFSLCLLFLLFSLPLPLPLSLSSSVFPSCHFLPFILHLLLLYLLFLLYSLFGHVNSIRTRLFTSGSSYVNTGWDPLLTESLVLAILQPSWHFPARSLAVPISPFQNDDHGMLISLLPVAVLFDDLAF